MSKPVDNSKTPAIEVLIQNTKSAGRIGVTRTLISL